MHPSISICICKCIFICIVIYISDFSYQSSAPQELHVTNENVEAMRVDFKLSPVETNYDGISSYYNPYLLRH